MLRLLPLAAMLLCATAQAAPTPWTRLGNPEGGDVGCFVFDAAHAGVVLAGSSGGMIYRSTDGGTQWSRIAVGHPTEEFRVIAQSPAVPGIFFAFSTGFASTPAGFAGRVYTSSDDGASWMLLPHQPRSADRETGLGRGMAIDQTGQIIVLSDHLDGVYRSTDGGQSWKSPLSGAVARPYGLARDTAHPGTLYLAGFTNSGHQAAIWRSADFGATWTQSTPPVMNVAPVQPLALGIAVQPGTGTVFATWSGQDAAGNSLAGVAQSKDAGASWTEADEGILPGFSPGSAGAGIVFDPTQTNTVYLTTDNVGEIDGGGLYRSTDGGAHWSPFGKATPYGGGFVAAARPALPGYPGAVFLGYPNIAYSIDGGTHWSAANKGFTNAPLLAVRDGGGAGQYYAATQTNVVFSSTSGRVWTQAGDWPGSHAVQALAVDATHAATAVFVATLDHVWRSTTTGGGHWTSVTPRSLTTGQYVSSLTTDTVGRLYATVGANTLYRSTDDGASWSSVNVGGSSDSFGGAEPLALTNAPAGGPSAGRIYASMSSGLWVSDDYGSSWLKNVAQPNPSGGQFVSMAVQPASPYALVVNASGGAVVSTDAAASFHATGQDLGGARLLAGVSGPQIYADVATSDVLASSDEFGSSTNVAAPLMLYDSQAYNAVSATAAMLFMSDSNGANFGVPFTRLH